MFHGETMVEAPFCTGHVEPRACGVKGLGYRAAYGVSHAGEHDGKLSWICGRFVVSNVYCDRKI